MGQEGGTIGYCGVPGAFAEQACLEFASSYLPVPLRSFRDVAVAVIERRIDRGMLPLTNSIAGTVTEVAELLANADLAICSRHTLEIRLHLLGAPGATLSGITLIKSHPMALKQCGDWLGAAGLTTQAEANTAAAAQAVAIGRAGHVAAIASGHAALIYGLTVLASNVHDRRDNRTTFGILKSRHDRHRAQIPDDYERSRKAGNSVSGA